MIRRILKTFWLATALSAVILLHSGTASATAFTWTAVSPGDWENAANWGTTGSPWTSSSNTFTITNNSTAATSESTNGTFTATLTVGTGGVLIQSGGSNSRTTTDLHLAGGSFNNATPNTGGLSSTSSLTADAGTTSSMNITALPGGDSGWWTVAAQLKGTGTIDLTQSVVGEFSFTNQTANSNTFSGGILNLGSGVTAQFGNTVVGSPTTLQGGTMNVNSGATWLVSGGNSTGQVNINTGGIASQGNTNSNVQHFDNVHLNGGTLQGITSGAVVGELTGSIYVDSDSTLGSTLMSGQIFTIGATFNSSHNLTVNTTNAGAVVTLQSPLSSESTYTGNWTIQKGNLTVSASGAGGNSDFSLGSDNSVSIASSQQLTFGDTSGNVWNIRQNVTGTGTMQQSGTGAGTDTLSILRSNDNVSGGLSPATTGGSGILHVSAPLDFEESTTGSHMPQLDIGVTGGNDVAGTDYDQLSVNSTVTNLANAALHVDVAGTLAQSDLTGDVLTILTGSSTNFATSGHFGAVVFDNPEWTATVNYNSNGTITLSNFLESEETPSVPEPSTMALAAMGLAALGFFGCRCRRPVPS